MIIKINGRVGHIPINEAFSPQFINELYHDFAQNMPQLEQGEEAICAQIYRSCGWAMLNAFSTGWHNAPKTVLRQVRGRADIFPKTYLMGPACRMAAEVALAGFGLHVPIYDDPIAGDAQQISFDRVYYEERKKDGNTEGFSRRAATQTRKAQRTGRQPVSGQNHPHPPSGPDCA